MSEIRDLYQEVILDHSKRPRNFRALPAGASARHADGHNPLCGDRVSVWVIVESDRITDVAFQGSGCAISTASASMMTEALKGKSLDEASTLFTGFHDLLTGKTALADQDLGKLRVFEGVRDFPVRVKCATLPWHTLRAALEDKDGAEPVRTE